jgi:hypothetical protein
LKNYNRFDNPIIYFVIILGIIKNENRLKRGDKYLYIFVRFIYYIRILFVEYIFPVITKTEQITENIDRFLKL